ncbi:GNAT family N-acetyltransferase [Longimicrobium terrae]|uniref:GNAT superfamily N-acetyltransferase n=1 Tax=Longimicrobium terrae TaxID=1639882 RepID=A0A841H0W9_9BACT|nr:GNAT family N-acetyltransferase [Longimicrobium terrae]MBB4637170.1 GNAT superfamily N-acetyltransferase [Longimicrobium terrae]MBB6071569.1 GNAT superfamily N-acetyltransferase [Longimicrobium terrae]NNC30012.1 GNAT family N-acetyltransferase [Longimicrobium terrae]
MADTELRLRDAGQADRVAMHRVTMDAYEQYAAVMPADEWRVLRGALLAALANDDPAVQHIVAERGDEVLGSVMIFPPAASAYGDLAAAVHWPELRLLAVSDAARGLGVGRALVEECIRRARAGGASHLGLHTGPVMAVARSMYERMGFIRDPEHDFTTPGGEVVAAYVYPLDGAEQAGR